MNGQGVTRGLPGVLTGRREYARADEAYWQYILRECREHHWRRQNRLLSFATADDWQQHCDGVRARFRATLGPLPERTPLNPRHVGVLERDGYVVEKLLIESQPDFYVTANLYRPAQIASPRPAILNPVGHWANAKAEEVVQARCIGLARRGYVALTYDPLGQGERGQFPEAIAASGLMRQGTSQHSAVALPCFLLGQTVITYMLWDGIRMLDYLESRPDVDRSRIGCTGASGGGYYTMFLNAFDPRIRVAVPVCSTTTHERKLSDGQISEPCQYPAGACRDDLDFADLLMSGVPNPLRIIAATFDVYPLIGAREVYLDVKSCYRALSVPERVSFVEVPARHDYNRLMREAMYAWFDRWLASTETDPVEAGYVPEPPERLWCTPTGQLFDLVGGETVLTLNRKRADMAAARPPRIASRDDAARHQEEVRRAVPETLQYIPGRSYSDVRVVDRRAEDGLTIESAVFETEPDLPIPGQVWTLTGQEPAPTVLFLDDRGKESEMSEKGLIPVLARAGCRVVAVDLRGWGETTWWQRFPFEADDVGFLGNDSMLTYASYLLGTWPITQRVGDTIRAIDAFGAPRLCLVGRGGGGLVALHAAALDPRVTTVAVYDLPVSYRAIVDADWYRLPPSAFLPGVLLHYDLPDLIGALAPRPVLVGNPTNAVGTPLPKEAARSAHDTALRMHELLGEGPGLTIRAGLDRSELVSLVADWIPRFTG
jgi:cephalosporin-C deacetylase-like acetyl esterase